MMVAITEFEGSVRSLMAIPMARAPGGIFSSTRGILALEFQLEGEQFAQPLGHLHAGEQQAIDFRRGNRDLGGHISGFPLPASADMFAPLGARRASTTQLATGLPASLRKLSGVIRMSAKPDPRRVSST